jgi:hypothetical protein
LSDPIFRLNRQMIAEMTLQQARNMGFMGTIGQLQAEFNRMRLRGRSRLPAFRPF